MNATQGTPLPPLAFVLRARNVPQKEEPQLGTVQRDLVFVVLCWPALVDPPSLPIPPTSGIRDILAPTLLQMRGPAPTPSRNPVMM